MNVKNNNGNMEFVFTCKIQEKASKYFKTEIENYNFLIKNDKPKNLFYFTKIKESIEDYFREAILSKLFV